jgi:hypothetical protein
MSDQDQLVPLMDGIKNNLGRKPKEASADAGYCSEANLEALAGRDVSAYLATGPAKHPAQGKRNITGSLTKVMRDKLKRAVWRSRYRFRKQIVEPVSNQAGKRARAFPLAWHREHEGRIGVDLHRPQSHQASQHRLGGTIHQVAIP